MSAATVTKPTATERPPTEALPALSTSVSRATDSLEPDQAVGASFLVESVLAQFEHRQEYAGGKGQDLSLAGDPDDPAARPWPAWLQAVRGLYDRTVVGLIDGRLLIYGLALLDRRLAGTLAGNGFLATLEDEILRRPVPNTNRHVTSVDDLLTEDGRLMRRLTMARLDPLPNHRDLPATVDELGRKAFATALAARIRRVQRNPTGLFVLHVQGPWGSGKTSLLNFLRDDLRSGDVPWVVIEFNAWQHQRIGPPWWWLLNAIYEQSRRQVRTARAVWIWVCEQGWRARVGWAPFAFAGVLLALGLWLLVSTGLLNQLWEPVSGQAEQPRDQRLKDFAEAVVAVVGIGSTVFFGMVGVGRLLLTGSARPPQTFLLTRDPMDALATHFEALITRVGRPVAIVIDDVDRCQGSYVVDLLEGIQTLFQRAPVTYVIAADRHWLRASFENVYGGYRGSVEEPGRPLGYLFLDKTFQLSAPVPHLPADVQAEYWNRLVGLSPGDQQHEVDVARDQATALAQSVATGADARTILHGIGDVVLRRRFAEQAVLQLASPAGEQATEHMLRPFAPLLEPNPRAMKRLVNAYGVRQASDLLSGGHADPLQLALWTILSLRWPLLAEYLETEPEAVRHAAPSGPPPDPHLPDDLRRLFENPAVRDVVHGTGIGVALDPEAIRACIGQLRPGPNGRAG